MATKPDLKSVFLFAIAIAVLVVAILMVMLGSSNYLIRSAGIIGLLISVGLVRISNFHRRVGVGVAQRGAFTKPPGILMWIAGVIILVVTILAFLYFALDNFHSLTPAYVFSALALLCAVYWGYLLSRIM